MADSSKTPMYQAGKTPLYQGAMTPMYGSQTPGTFIVILSSKFYFKAIFQEAAPRITAHKHRITETAEERRLIPTVEGWHFYF